jgi:hypothetical protein
MGSLATGGLLGFLFGVPRWVAPEKIDGRVPSGYQPNTNIEVALVALGFDHDARLAESVAVGKPDHRVPNFARWPNARGTTRVRHDVAVPTDSALHEVEHGIFEDSAAPSTAQLFGSAHFDAMGSFPNLALVLAGRLLQLLELLLLTRAATTSSACSRSASSTTVTALSFTARFRMCANRISTSPAGLEFFIDGAQSAR